MFVTLLRCITAKCIINLQVSLSFAIAISNIPSQHFLHQSLDIRKSRIFLLFAHKDLRQPFLRYTNQSCPPMIRQNDPEVVLAAHEFFLHVRANMQVARHGSIGRLMSEPAGNINDRDS